MMTLQQEVAHWKRLATTDELTGLNNRRALDDVGPGWFVVCDLDGFKTAQDAHPDGHAFGDRVLREFADFLRANTRDTDRVAARVGGDEFVIYCPTVLGARRICGMVRAWNTDRVGASAGMGSSISAADAAMYLDKTS